MWLWAKRFIWSNEKEEKDELQKVIQSYFLKDNKIFKDMEGYELKELRFEVGYWRKANQIHNWFVENVQKGEDDCGSYSVEKEQLQELLETINQILNEKDKKKQIELAKELLSTKEGSFFGNYEYDKYYFDDLKETKEIIEKLLKIKNLEDYEIEYSSSW